MKDKQWEVLKRVINGEVVNPLPIGFIIDCPWLPNWYGINILDYFTNDELWLNANLKAMNDFPDVMFLPGFWSEYGMCTEPSAFGARSVFPANEFPHAHRVISSADDIENLVQPNPQTDGLLPFMLNRPGGSSSRSRQDQKRAWVSFLRLHGTQEKLPPIQNAMHPSYMLA